jgi:DNA integrity scanning protein DisA with diadenylate cyclase activity
MKKLHKTIVIPLLVILLGIAVFGFIDYRSKETVSVIQKNSSSQNQPAGGTYLEIQEDRSEPIEKELPNKMTEEQVQDAIHQMSHQKVRAEKKWGFIPLTRERVDRLIEVINANQYEHEDVYLDILKEWKESNFSNIDGNHNAIWVLQDGNVGKATGILTLEEEMKYIEQHYMIMSEKE